MNIYLVSSQELTLNEKQQALLKTAGNFKIIAHKGKLSDIAALCEDLDQKVIGLDPDVVDWNLGVSEFDVIKNVKAICTQSTSFGWMNPDELKKRGIEIYNVPGFSTDSVAEYAIALAIETARRLPLHLKDMSLDWKTQPMLLRGKKLGIIGLGKIGTRIAEIGKGLGMNVAYWSPNTRDERFKYQELTEIFVESDVLIPAMKDTEGTKNIITHSLIDSMKSSAIVVGINRVKDLFDEKYVIAQVELGKLGGYGFEGDNAKEINSNANVWGVPSIAWYTQDSVANLIDGWIESVVKVSNS